MGRFFYSEEQHQIDRIYEELDNVTNEINRLAKRGRRYVAPADFSNDWLFFTSSGGDVIQEDYIRENFTRLQVLKRVLMRSIEVLHSYQDAEKK